MADYDFLIIGSGFGGSVSALRLSEKGYRVGVIEMGRRYRPQDFPRTNWDLRRYLWLPALGLHGIQRLTLLKDILILSGVGVGGGSLVYAATLLVPPEEIWDDPRWAGLCDWRKVMPAHYRTAQRMLGVAENPRLFRTDEVLRKYAASIGREETFHRARVGVFFGPGEGAEGGDGNEGKAAGRTFPDPYFGGQGPARTACVHCGGCMVGCRHGAKNTLDQNYLYLAEHLHGAQILPELRVDRIEPLPDLDGRPGYRVVARSTRSRLQAPRSFTAHQVVLSGGVLGTVPLLLRCQKEGLLPNLSRHLGSYVRTNSEAILGVTTRDPEADLSRGVAITSGVYLDDKTHMEVVRYPAGSDAMGLLGTLLTDGGPGLPRALRWALACARHPLDFLRTLWPFGWARSTVILLVMQTLPGHMRLRLRRTLGVTTENDGAHKNPTYIPAANDAARGIAALLDGVPQSALNEVLLDVPTTAHILGGCPMGRSADDGVIDAAGRVFGHPGLYVIDGSMIGANLGVNPSLTITALSEHAMSQVPRKGEREPTAGWPS